MTQIRTTCAVCGEVELVPAELTLELTALNGTGTYLFSCPTCGDPQRRPANHRVVSILLATGVAYEVVEDGGPITESEIRRFIHAHGSVVRTARDPTPRPFRRSSSPWVTEGFAPPTPTIRGCSASARLRS